MVVYSEIQTLISDAQNSSALLTSIVSGLQQPTNLTCYDFKTSQGGFIANDGTIRPLPHGAQSTWTANVGWDAGPSSGTYGHECIIYQVFNPAITIASFFLSWENLQGSVRLVIEARYQGGLKFSQLRDLTAASGVAGEWADVLNAPDTIDQIGLISSNISPNTNPPERVTFTHLRLE
jgi:hypothetical protein